MLMHFNYGGAEKMVSLLASHLDLSKCEARVFCVFGQPENNAMERAVEEHGVPIVYLGKGRGFSLRHVTKTRKLLEDFGADIVHTHLGGAVYCTTWAMLHGGKMLHTLHNIPIMEFGKAKRTLMRVLYHTGLAIPVAISELNKGLTAAFYGLSPEKVEMVVNPVDFARFSDKSPKLWGDRTWDFVHVARFGKAKNHRGLIDATAILKKRGYEGLRIALVGTGPLEQEIRERVSDLGLEANVDFLGLRDDVPEILHDSRCFILPSIYEGLPMSILEAMASGLPVLATTVGGVPDVVKSGVTGLLVEPGDTAALACAMADLLESPDRALAMARAGKAAAEAYDCSTVAASYLNLYEKYGGAR